MTTKAERQAEEAAAQRRADALEIERDRQTHLVDPLTHPSSGDPPPAISEAGDRLGAVPMTRNAVADTRQAEQEGLEAAKRNQPTKAEKQASKPKARHGSASSRAGKSSKPKSTAQHSSAGLTSPSTEKIEAKRDEAAEKTQTPSMDRPSWLPPFNTTDTPKP